MKYDGEIQCPVCGSMEAVSKSCAWDAAAKLPPKYEEELIRLRNLEDTVKMMLSDSNKPQLSYDLQVSVSDIHITKLRALLK